MIVSGTPVIKDPVLVFIFGAVFVQHFVNCKYHILPIIRKCSFCCFSVRQSTMPHIHNPLPISEYILLQAVIVSFHTPFVIVIISE